MGNDLSVWGGGQNHAVCHEVREGGWRVPQAHEHLWRQTALSSLFWPHCIPQSWALLISLHRTTLNPAGSRGGPACPNLLTLMVWALELGCLRGAQRLSSSAPHTVKHQPRLSCSSRVQRVLAAVGAQMPCNTASRAAQQPVGWRVELSQKKGKAFKIHPSLHLLQT